MVYEVQMFENKGH